MRNIRDYKAKVRPDNQSLGSASPFNIITELLTLKNFTKEEITSLYQQHTDETGQRFGEDAIEPIFEQTQGQPWLVNAIAREVIIKMLQPDYIKPVTAGLVSDAIQAIIMHRDMHIDSPLERRVRKVIEFVITGKDFIGRLSDDFIYVKDLGLISDTQGRLALANPIYAEVIARTLTLDTQQILFQDTGTYPIPSYLKAGHLDMDSLMRDFQQFWRENSAIWKNLFDYKEASS
jgi:hypothetical protein